MLKKMRDDLAYMFPLLDNGWLTKKGKNKPPPPFPLLYMPALAQGWVNYIKKRECTSVVGHVLYNFRLLTGSNTVYFFRIVCSNVYKIILKSNVFVCCRLQEKKVYSRHVCILSFLFFHLKRLLIQNYF